MGELNADDPISLTATQRAAREEIMATPIPAENADAIENEYRGLGDDVAVAVRLSGTTEDAGDSSFAGMNASFTHVIGLPNVLARVTDCWASLYGERVLAYRAEQHLTEEPAIAVIIQKMIFSEVSGVIFTGHPTTEALDRMIIESVFGQGEAIVSGRVEPDTYILDKAGPRLLSVRHGKQKFKIVRGPDGADVEQPLDAGEVDRRSLSQAEIIAIAELGLRAQQHYGTPQTWNGHGRREPPIWCNRARSPPSAVRRHPSSDRRLRLTRLSYSLAWRHLQGARQGGYGSSPPPISNASSSTAKSWSPR
jgi:pyruvate,water dikinase